MSTEYKGHSYGIYCIIPIGKLYDENILKSVRWRLRKYLGVTIKNLSNSALNNEIKLFLIRKIEDIFSSKHNTGYITTVSDRESEYGYNSSDLDASFGYAIYHNGKRVHKDLVPFSKKSSSSSNADADLNAFFQVNRGKSNIQSALNTDGWAIMLAVAHYMAARTEATTAYPDNKYKGYGQMVLMSLALETSLAIRTSLGRTAYGGFQYGYILSRKGYEGRQYRVI